MVTKKEADKLRDKIKDAARTIYTELGGGYLETVYEEAMAVELRERKIKYEVERNKEVFYKNVKVGEHRLDFIVENYLVVELKAGTGITSSHVGQTYAYLKANDLEYGLICNFPYPDSHDDKKLFKDINKADLDKGLENIE